MTGQAHEENIERWRSEQRSEPTVKHEYPWYVKAMTFFVMAWVAVQLTLQLWTMAQQTLVAQSQTNQALQQAQQQTQSLRQQIEAERAERAKGAKP